MYGLKIIRPLRILLLRIFNENMGITNLHSLFLKLCNKYFVPKEALPILVYPGLFKNISNKYVVDYLIEGCDIYLKLKEYAKAYDLVVRGNSLDFIDSDKAVKLYERHILLEMLKGGPIS